MAAPIADAAPARAGHWRLYTPARRVLFLTILFLVATSSVVDRIIISVLLEPIKNEFHVSDAALGLLGGLAFTLLYATLGIPIARWADRGNRVQLITLALSVWSVMTVLCGMVGSFAQLVLARVGVGAGEAGAMPPLQSLVADYFPPTQRARAIGALATAPAIGFLIGLSLGSQLIGAYGWRLTLIIFGLPGLIVALLVWFVLDEPRRSAVKTAQAKPESFWDSIRDLAMNRSYRLLLVVTILHQIIGSGTSMFVPSHMVRVLHKPIAEAGMLYGAVTAVSVLVGSLGGGALCDGLVRRDGRWLAWFPAIGFSLAVVPFCGSFLVDDFTTFLILNAVGAMPIFAAVPALYAAVHAVCGNSRRATAIAVVLFFGSLIGSGLGPVLTGALSDLFTAAYGPAGLRYALALVLALVIPAAAMLLVATAPVIRQDLKD